MKKTLTIFITGIILMTGSLAYAQEEQSSESLKDLIDAVREDIQELREDVENGELELEEAQRIKASYIERLRADKKAFFDAQFEEKQEKIQILSEKNPELGMELQARLQAAQTLRLAAQQERAQIRIALESGEITREEARELEKEAHGQYIELRKNVQTTFIETIRIRNPERAEKMEEKINENMAKVEEKRAELEKKRIEMDEKRAEKRQERMSDDQERVERRAEVESRIESGEITREEARSQAEVERPEREALRIENTTNREGAIQVRPLQGAVRVIPQARGSVEVEVEIETEAGVEVEMEDKGSDGQ